MPGGRKVPGEANLSLTPLGQMLMPPQYKRDTFLNVSSLSELKSMYFYVVDVQLPCPVSGVLLNAWGREAQIFTRPKIKATEGTVCLLLDWWEGSHFLAPHWMPQLMWLISRGSNYRWGSLPRPSGQGVG